MGGVKRSGWFKLWVLVLLLALGGGSAALFWLTRYRPVEIGALEADLALAKRAMQKTARSPEAMLAVRHQQERLRLAREFNAALEASSDADTLRGHWEAFRAADAKAAESLGTAASAARLEAGDRW